VASIFSYLDIIRIERFNNRDSCIDRCQLGQIMRKYIERQISSPGILIFREKHCHRYFVCNTKEDFCKAAMKILRERLEDDYWYYDDDEKEELLKQEAFNYSGAIYKATILCKDRTLAQQISDSNNIEAAFEFLDDHKSGEYENMTIERGEDFDE
jgi:hypothetical protein